MTTLGTLRKLMRSERAREGEREEMERERGNKIDVKEDDSDVKYRMVLLQIDSLAAICSNHPPCL